MTVKVAINGFGRIGRLFLRAAWGNPDIDIVAVNDLGNAITNAHLLKYDSTHGIFVHDVEATEEGFAIDGKKIQSFSERDPANLPWSELGVDVIIESTGKFNDATKAAAHIQAGAKKVILTAPGKNEDITIVMGVNEDKYLPDKHHIISNASCTTNCLAPVAKIINDHFGIKKGFMTTVHAYTNDQRILDQEHKDLRRARTAAASIIPTTTGAAKAISLVMPEMKGKLDGMAMRVPTQNVSVVDLVVELAKDATKEELNAVLKKAAEGEWKGKLLYSELPLVSIDFNGESHSSIVDALSTMVIGGNMAKFLIWYDNEWGYTCRVVDLLLYIYGVGRA